VEIPDSPRRLKRVRAAVATCLFSTIWSALAGAVALVTGLITRSLVLVAFGLASLVDASTSGMLVWRFGLELRSHEHSQSADRAEQATLRVVGVVLLLVSAYVGAQAVRALIAPTAPKRGLLGLFLLAVSIVVLSVVGPLKLHLARELDSLALRGDGVLSSAGAGLAVVALVGLALERSFGWRWTDPIAALLIAAVLLPEGWRAVRA
jgi:divalent metal cation (Fe/Co/Zn/Cd) transporter